MRRTNLHSNVEVVTLLTLCTNFMFRHFCHQTPVLVELDQSSVVYQLHMINRTVVSRPSQNLFSDNAGVLQILYIKDLTTKYRSPNVTSWIRPCCLLCFKILGNNIEMKRDKLSWLTAIQETMIPVVLNQGGAPPQVASKNFQGGASPYAPYNIESLINKFNNEYTCFNSLFNVRVWNKVQYNYLREALQKKVKNRRLDLLWPHSTHIRFDIS